MKYKYVSPDMEIIKFSSDSKVLTVISNQQTESPIEDNPAVTYPDYDPFA